MEFHLTLSNYRCFGSDRPAILRLRSGVQAFVGVNNAGKSTLVRSLYELRDLFATFNTAHNFLNALRNGPQGGIRGPIEQIPFRDVIRTGQHEASVQLHVKNDLGVIEGSCLRLRLLEDERCSVDFPELPKIDSNAWNFMGDWNIEGSRAGEGNIRVNTQLLSKASMSASEVMFLPAARAPFSGQNSGQGWYDVPLGSMLVNQLDAWETNKDRRLSDRFHAVVCRLREVLEIQDLEIRPVPGASRIDVRLRNATRRLEEIGSGIGQFIVSAIAVALKNPSYLLLDEPDSNLHPRLQVKYIELLRSFVRHGVLFSTHSLGLARTVADDVWVLTPQPNGTSVVETLESPETSLGTLAELQFGARPELGASAVLFVEGPNDVRTVRMWLRILSKESRVIVFHLNGGSGISASGRYVIDEARRFHLPVYVLIDSERTSENAPLHEVRQEFVRHCEAINANVHVTKRRAIENYLSDCAIRSSNAALKAPGPYETCTDLIGGKRNGWRVAEKMTREELEANDVGKFLLSIPG